MKQSSSTCKRTQLSQDAKIGEEVVGHSINWRLIPSSLPAKKMHSFSQLESRVTSILWTKRFGHSDPCINLVIDGDGDGDLNGTVNITMQKSSVDLTLNEEVSFSCLS